MLTKEDLKKSLIKIQTELDEIKYAKKKFFVWFNSKMSNLIVGESYEDDCLNFSYLSRDLRGYSEVIKREHELRDRQQNIEIALRTDNLELLS